ncbi:MAG: hypothetical protein F9K46_16745, partial [Anaerolineae bacterium]
MRRSYYTGQTLVVIFAVSAVLLGLPSSVKADSSTRLPLAAAQTTSCVFPVDFELAESYGFPTSIGILFGIDCLGDVDHVTFDLATEDITAQADSDYVPLHLTNLRIGRWDPAPLVWLTVQPDAIAEPAETLYIHLTNIVFHADPASATNLDVALPTGPYAVSSIVTITDFTPPGIQLSPNPIGFDRPNCVTSEDGATCQFEVWLGTPPTANVTLNLTTGRFDVLRPPEAVVLADQLVFTPTNHAVPQTVTVRGLDDDEQDNGSYGGIIYTIVIRASSPDPNYEGVVVLYHALNLDNDANGPIVEPTEASPPSPSLSTQSISVPFDQLADGHLAVISAETPVVGYDAPDGSPIQLNGQPLV